MAHGIDSRQDCLCPPVEHAARRLEVDNGMALWQLRSLRQCSVYGVGRSHLTQGICKRPIHRH
eukprot:8126560-Lingulodinium_polyedra.AAC.1